MSNIKSRIAALETALQARYPQCTTPYDQLDSISQAIVDLIDELKALDTQGKADGLDAVFWNGGTISMEELDAMIRAIAVEY